MNRTMATSMRNSKKTELDKNNIIETSTTASGLKIDILEKGDGVQPAMGQTIVAHYTGKLQDGTIFDSSRSRQPFEFPLGQGRVIKGWDEGFATMTVGTRAILTIPPQLGYGDRGAGTIPPNSILIFDVELMEVK